MKHKTLSNEWLLQESGKIRQYAADNLAAWDTSGEICRYNACMNGAEILERAIFIKNFRERRAFLRDKGVKC